MSIFCWFTGRHIEVVIYDTRHFVVRILWSSDGGRPGGQQVISLFGSVFRWDFRRVINSDWESETKDQPKSEVVFRLDSVIRWDQTLYWAISKSKAN